MKIIPSGWWKPDVKLMLLTLKIIFWPDSTEGVEAEQITALREEKKRREQAENKDEL